MVSGRGALTSVAEIAGGGPSSGCRRLLPV